MNRNFVMCIKISDKFITVYNGFDDSQIQGKTECFVM